jgi:hypothetical protein
MGSEEALLFGEMSKNNKTKVRNKERTKKGTRQLRQNIVAGYWRPQLTSY